MLDGRIAPNTGHLYNGARITTCPECGKEKWAYIGGDLPAEPPCFSCQTPEYFERKRQAEAAPTSARPTGGDQ